MPRLLSEQELQGIRKGGDSAYGLVSAATVGLLLDHIEAQEETLQEYRETLASQYAAIVEDKDLHQQLETAQAAAAAIRQAAEVLRKLQRSHETERIWFFEGRTPVQQDEIIGKMCEAEDALDAALSGTAGRVPLDALAPLGLVSSEWNILTEVDYLRADLQHLQDVAGAAEQLYRVFHKPSMVRWEDTVKLWMSCLHEALRQAGYLREKADAE